MSIMRSAVFLLAVLPAAATRVDTSINPVRKVVTLLQKMEAKVKEEGEKEKELYEKFMCYCKTGGGTLTASIEAAETKLPQLAAQIESAESAKAETEATLAQARSDLKDAKAAMAAATAQREKQAAAFAKFQADSVANIGAITKAVAALEKGMAGGFLQTGAASVLKNLAENSKVDMADDDRQQLLAFLSGPFSQGYSAQSGSITGILKQMGDEMASGLAEATAAEEKSIAIYNQLMSAKTEESDVLLKMIETKIQKSGELAVSIAQMKNDAGDTAEALAEDKEFLASMEKSCATKTAEWEERSKTRADELVALAETIKILNDDDALELFKKTLPGSASFVQVSSGSHAVRARARALVELAASKAGRQDHAMMQFIALALQGKKIGFEKVISMIDEMVATLKKEQEDDDSKKEYCSTELDTSDDKKKSLEKTISDTDAAIAAAEEGISTLTEEIAALKDGIAALDKSVADATAQRKDENAEYKDLMASNTAAKELLKMAENRLNQFYNPKLYKPPAKVERSSMDAISQDVGGAAVLVQISEHRRLHVAPPPPPETFGAYTKKTEENGGVMAMITLLIKDLDKEMTEAETTEKDSQADYETLMKESADKRAEDSKMMVDKEGAKADLEGDLQAHKTSLKEAKQDLAATMKYIYDLHQECDWLLKYFDVRKEMRASEVDALGKAKAVLNGADFSLLETRSSGFLGRS